MTTANEFIDLAASQIGNGGSKYNTWYWGSDNNAFWCATFLSWVADQMGGAGFKSAAVSTIHGQLPTVATMSLSGVQKGDLVCFNWDGRTATNWMDHIGAFESLAGSPGEFYTIEGNTDNLVRRRKRSLNAGYYASFVRPAYDGTTGGGSTSTGTSGGIAVDGAWGSQTTRAAQVITRAPYLDGVISRQENDWQAQNPGLTSGWEWLENPSGGSQTIKLLQGILGVKQDGLIGPVTITAFQARYGTVQDGVFDNPSPCIKAFQQAINAVKI